MEFNEVNKMNGESIIEMPCDEILTKKIAFIGTMQKVFGVLAVIGGALSCIGIITAIIGVPYIIAGVKLFKSGSQFSYISYSKDGKFLSEALMSLAGFWKFTLISIIAILVLYAILFIALFVFGVGYHY